MWFFEKLKARSSIINKEEISNRGVFYYSKIKSKMELPLSFPNVIVINRNKQYTTFPNNIFIDSFQL